MPTAPRLIPQPKSIKPLKGFCDRDVATRRNAKLVHDPALAPEAYRLRVSAEGVMVTAATALGMRWAFATLQQLRAQYGRSIPAMQIDDAPDFDHRGFMLDVSRGKVPTLETLKSLVETLWLLKYNHFELYVEHTYDFKKHPLLPKGHSPLTAKELRAIDEHCKLYGIAFTPNLQSFGHHWHTLRHAKYKKLAESDYRGGWTLSPTEPGTYKLIEELYDEFLPNFPDAPLFNVGCDETWDLCKGKSAALAKKIGAGGVYMRHILRVHKLARARGKRMMFWGDVIANHPEQLAAIPKDVILLNWGYEAHGQEKDYRKRLAPAARSGLEHWVCPGTSSWNSFFFRMTNARANLRAMAREGLRAGASGYLVTDWGDNGHYNTLGASLWPLAYGADCAWRAKPDAKAEKDFDRRFAAVMLGDREGKAVEPLRLLGDLYLDFGVAIPNNSAERWLFTGNPRPEEDVLGMRGELTKYNAITKAALRKALKKADRAEKALRALVESKDGWRMLDRAASGVDATLALEEWSLGARLSAFACRRALLLGHGEGNAAALRGEAKELAREFERLWLARNKKSDLELNRRDFARIIEELQGASKRAKKEPVLF